MKRARGFTLIELVVVIVLMGITAVTMTILFTGAVSGYIDNARRLDSASSARIALDRMGRELREAMPLSIRINTVASSSCIQFLPVLGSSIYTTFPINTNTISVLDFTAPTASPIYAAIYPVNANQLYQLVAMKLISGIGAESAGLRTITLSSASTFPRQSPAERVYIVGEPVSFCLESNGELNRYTSAVTAIQPLPAAMNGKSLLADNLDFNNEPFKYDIGNWRANGLVTIVLAISRDGSGGVAETLQLDHEVRIRNVQ